MKISQFTMFLVLIASVTNIALPVANAQVSRNTPTQIKGNIEINAETENMNAVATGNNSVAINRVGVVDGQHKGNTKISVSAKNVTTVSSGRDRKACTTIGGVTNAECK